MYKVKPINLAVILIFIAFSGTLDLIAQGGAVSEGLEKVLVKNQFLKNLTQLFIMLVICIITIMAIKFKKINLKPNFLLWTLFILLIAISLNSINIKNSIKSLSYILAAAFTIYYQVKIYGKDYCLRFIDQLFFVFLIFNLLTIIFIPSYGIAVAPHEGSWQGLTTHKNSLGNLSALAYTYFISNPQKSAAKKSTLIVKVLLSLALVIGSQSYTAIGSVIIVTTYYFLHKILSNKWRRVVRLLSIPSVIAASLIAVYLSLNGSGYTIIDKASNYSGRNLIWAYSLSNIIENFYLGHGLSSYSTFVQANEQSALEQAGFLTASLHNGFLEILFDGGIIGLMVVLTWIIFIIKKGWSENHLDLTNNMIIIIILSNTFESKLIGMNWNILILFYLFYFSTNNGIKNKKHRPYRIINQVPA